MTQIPIYRAKKIYSGGWNKENHKLSDWDGLYCDSTIENLNILLDLGYKVIRDSDQCYNDKDPFKGNSGKYIFIEVGFSKRVDKCWLNGQNLHIRNSFGGKCEFFNPSSIINKNEYVIGSYINGKDGKHYISIGEFKIRASSGASLILTEIDPSTLSIHFNDMLDSQGNKIFASLSEDGKGGDRILEESRLSCTLKVDDSAFREFTAIHTINGNRFVKEKILSDIGAYKDKHFKGYDIMIYDFFMMKKRKIKVIGVQQ